MHERLIADSTATYRALLALYCDAEGGDAIRSRTVASGDRPGFPELTATKTSEGKAVAAEIARYREWLGEQPSAAVPAIELGVAKVVAHLQHAPPATPAERADGPFATGPWDDVRVRRCEVSTPPHEILSDELAPQKRRSDFVCLSIGDKIADKIEFVGWMHRWDAELRERWPRRIASALRVAAVGNRLGSRLTATLEDRRIVVIDRDRGNFDASPATAVRQKLAWDAGTTKRLALAQVNQGFRWPGSPPSGRPSNEPAVDPAYEAFPAHVLRSEFDRWVWELTQEDDGKRENLASGLTVEGKACQMRQAQ